MAWDTARTKRLLLDAAVEEFAEHGPQGARVDRIAACAGVNKERIYQYFGGKGQLFTAVLEAELAKVAAAVPLTGDRAADLGEYAGRVFDYHRAHPHFLRLLSWEGLQDDGREAAVAEGERRAHYADKLAAFARAQAAGEITGDFDPAHLLYAVFALTTWWFSAPQVVRMMMGGTAADSPEARREALVRMVHRLTTA
ncbi:AcrR family transcriptional regulator [Streptosporangium becharense]|uniref:AcrR family transcriptional regulator n=1 Tax=Streptosporangium becharense TaxID=1816182 RepID=A0A7W9IB57_9ACTN|nr:TetR family transcriptional regulator [Streptosporangium becharense]MBB2910807.1 AcrR family transcriptional regulator [Streptosporangium becharense]MBB5817502.1 AcrR family transcriptional regulator [Streptosporangium becharense]